MNVGDIRTIITDIDPEAKHYLTTLDGESYTVWAEIRRTGLEADDGYAELGWEFDDIRYTTDEFDEMPQKIEDALIEHPLIAFTYTVDVDPESGYIVHLFNCVG